jgi:photosystem II stability/assembly factor-like uncharacterized protein
MWQHLDDPTPPVPDIGRYAAVLRRSADLRAQRRWRRSTGAVIAVLVGALAVTSGLSITARGHGASAVDTAYQFERQPVPRPGVLVPASALSDVVFTGTTRTTGTTGTTGFALAVHDQHLVLAGSTDAGRAWRVIDGRMPSLGAVPGTTATGTAQIQFTSRADGYFWTAPSVGESPSALWTTSDGGTAWSRAPIGPTVYDATAIQRNVWALVGSCPGTGAACTLWVEVSTDGGTTWQPAPGLVPASVGPGASLVELARVSTTSAYVYSGVDGTATLAFTSDAGATWSTRPVPCTAPDDLGAELALSSTADLWLVCGGQASGGSQEKALFRSSDAGETWALAAETPGLGSTGAAPPPGIGVLPVAGYVAPYSIGHKNLAVLTPSTAWLFPSRGVVSVTTDGGTTWKVVAPLADAGFGAGAPGNVTFTTDTDGWVVELGVGLWRTTDGVHWRAAGA